MCESSLTIDAHCVFSLFKFHQRGRLPALILRIETARGAPGGGPVYHSAIHERLCPLEEQQFYHGRITREPGRT